MAASIQPQQIEAVTIDTTDSNNTSNKISELSGRALAYIERIQTLTAIKDVDHIEIAHVRGWSVVVRKDFYQAGDLIVYFEIDSVLPPWPCFIADKFDTRGFRVKSMKVRGHVSQGYIISIPTLIANHPAAASIKIIHNSDSIGNVPTIVTADTQIRLEPGTNLTTFIGVKQYEDPTSSVCVSKKQYAIVNYLPWPECIPKTDQLRVQNFGDAEYRMLCTAYNNEKILYEVTEKLDGTSVTTLTTDTPGEVWVCTRNYRITIHSLEEARKVVAGLPWTVLEDTGVLNCLKSYRGPRIALQGELIGPGISNNLYHLMEHEWRVFDVYLIEEHRYALPEERIHILDQLGLDPKRWHVPVLQRKRSIDPDITTSEMLIKEAEGTTVLNNTTLLAPNTPTPTANVPEIPEITEKMGRIVINKKKISKTFNKKKVKLWPDMPIIREGLVFKSEQLIDNKIVHFKVVSNAYLMKK